MDNNDKTSVFFLEAYKTRIEFFSQHATRTWNRFNLLLTVELALSGFFFKLWFERCDDSPNLWLFPALGILVSTIWYILGAQDLNAYLGYRTQINDVEKLAAKAYGVDVKENKPGKPGENDFPAFNPLGTKEFNLTHWRWPPISLSNLLSLIPLFFVALWILALIIILKTT